MKTRSFPTVVGAALALAAISAAAQAQQVQTTAGWEQPYGGTSAQASQTWPAGPAGQQPDQTEVQNRIILTTRPDRTGPEHH